MVFHHLHTYIKPIQSLQGSVKGYGPRWGSRPYHFFKNCDFSYLFRTTTRSIWWSKHMTYLLKGILGVGHTFPMYNVVCVDSLRVIYDNLIKIYPISAEAAWNTIILKTLSTRCRHEQDKHTPSTLINSFITSHIHIKGSAKRIRPYHHPSTHKLYVYMAHISHILTYILLLKNASNFILSSRKMIIYYRIYSQNIVQVYIHHCVTKYITYHK